MGLFLAGLGLLLLFVGLVLLVVNIVFRLGKQKPPSFARWPFLVGSAVVALVLVLYGGVLITTTYAAEHPSQTTSGKTSRSQKAPAKVTPTPSSTPVADTPATAPTGQDSARQTPDPTAARETTGTPIDVAAFVLQCQEAVTSQLKSPSTARFAGTVTKLGQVRELENNGRMWSGYVDAQNGFGATVREDFICAYSSKTGRVSATVQD